jgi:hypothetical protein
MFTFFGQFFDHGLDLVTKGGGTVLIPLQPDDPLFVPGSQTNFMVMTRGQNQPGPDGILGTADDIQESINTTTPWVDQNQTYTSHPSHQVFLREYVMNAAGRPVPDGKMLDGGFCTPRPTGIPGDNICNIGNWAEVKAQAATKLGIQLVDQDVLDCPLLLTDPYGHFKPGSHGFPQLVLPGGVLLEGIPRQTAAPASSYPRRPSGPATRSSTTSRRTPFRARVWFRTLTRRSATSAPARSRREPMTTSCSIVTS